MKKKLLSLLMPLLILGMTSCVMYNGQGKPGTNKSSSTTPASSSQAAPSENSGEPVSSQPGNSSDVTPSSSQNPQPSSEANSDELPKGTDVKVYLVFGPYALYKGNPVNTNIDALFLEHAIEFEAKVGSALPGSQDVTSTVENSRFLAWTSYNNDGKLTDYLLVPGYQNKILYASFTGGNGGGQQTGGSGGSGQVTPVVPGEYTPATEGALPTSGYGFKFSDGTYMDATRTNDDNGFSQYLINHRKFSKDQIFQLYDFGENAGWTVSIDPYSFGGDNDMATNWKAYIAHDTQAHTYKVLQDFNAESIYIKLKYGEDQIFFQLGE